MLVCWSLSTSSTSPLRLHRPQEKSLSCLSLLFLSSTHSWLVFVLFFKNYFIVVWFFFFFSYFFPLLFPPIHPTLRFFFLHLSQLTHTHTKVLQTSIRCKQSYSLNHWLRHKEYTRGAKTKHLETIIIRQKRREQRHFMYMHRRATDEKRKRGRPPACTSISK